MTPVYISEIICKQAIRLFPFFSPYFLLLPLIFSSNQQQNSFGTNETLVYFKLPSSFCLSFREWILVTDTKLPLGLWDVFLTKQTNKKASLFLWPIFHLYTVILNRKKILFLLPFSATVGCLLPLRAVRALMSLHFSSPFHIPLNPFCKVKWHFQSSAPFQNDF